MIDYTFIYYVTDEFQYQHEPEPDRYDDKLDLKVNENDEDLADLWKSKTDDINVDDYDPFGDKAFDDYLDKRGQSFKVREELYYKPQKVQKRTVSSKELLAAQPVLNQELSQDSNKSINKNTPTPPPSKPKPKQKPKQKTKGFKTMKVKQKVRTSSPKFTKSQNPFDNIDQDNEYNDNNDNDDNDIDDNDNNNNNNNPDLDIDDIEKYITQQQQSQHDGNNSGPERNNNNNNNNNILNSSLNSSMPLPSDNSPDPGTPIDIIEHDSSPEPQRNSSFQVVKKQKPKKRKKKRKDKDKEDSKDKKDRKDKKKRKKKKKDKKNAMAMEPEDCTIRYENDTQTYKEMITNKLYSGAAMIRNKVNETSKQPTNPFDAINHNQESTNPFDANINNDNNNNNNNGNSNNLENTNPFGPSTNKQKSTNPFFAADGDLP